ncbi:MAG: hypothetical protein K0R61_4633 [Microvirga sp.]|nr:hypothetical protein [Microvirga sp.]
MAREVAREPQRLASSQRSGAAFGLTSLWMGLDFGLDLSGGAFPRQPVRYRKILRIIHLGWCGDIRNAVTSRTATGGGQVPT